ncbi:hypothetical protein ASD79_02035 [Caulobacter sp. Root655]|uniref:hypothetical protein n=1 Tax=Caulobacter sp. Root655 TaxID=1736578 RepID=UPI0006FCB032|nr:hypothetical protein [Caulobacter sp. Root655]KRA66086.1 hypothetical protein ASD79_02035 [Caulobacter sp. Root655]
MTRRFLTMVGVVMAALAATAMAEPPPINVDLITVSGRHGLPRGEGSPIAGRLLVKDVTVDPSAATLFKTDVATVGSSLRQGVEKTLRNHGYLAAAAAEPAAGGAPPLAIVVEMSGPDIQADAEGATAIARLSVGPPADSPAIACLPYTATGKFRALTPLKSGGGQRATGIIFGALAGPVGGVFMANQLQNATANNVALNSRRTVAAGEGVSPQHGAPAVARHASINAVQMALIDLVKHLGETEGCKAPAKPPVIVPPVGVQVQAAPTPDT